MTDEEERVRVLIVDDDAVQLRLIERGLSFEGLEVKTLDNPIGVSLAAREFSPDVVLIDVNIPGLSGDRLLPLLRRNTSATRPRLVLFSACDPEELRALAIKTGADAWIPKGGDSEELARRLRRMSRPRSSSSPNLGIPS